MAKSNSRSEALFDQNVSEVYQEELRLALLAEDLGFDCIWVVEHHFFDYSFCPDNLQLLTYLAAKTHRIDLGTAAVIMPWNDPLRVAEKWPCWMNYRVGERA